MAHYAFLDDNNIVTEVISGIDETELIDGISPEEWYGNFRNQKCKRTSYTGSIRGCFAGIGYSYNGEEDIFIVPQPYPSWVRNGFNWQAPIAYPDNGSLYRWNELEQQWIEIINN